MAENESLDLDDPGARRWDAVCGEVRKGKSCEEVGKLVRTKLRQALCKAQKQFAEKGISFSDFLANRDSPRALEQLVSFSEGHDYADLFLRTAAAEKGTPTYDLFYAYVSGVWEAISDRISQVVIGSDHWPNYEAIQAFLNQVRSEIESEVQQLSERLTLDPTCIPSKREKGGSKSNPTADLLFTSLLGLTR